MRWYFSKGSIQHLLVRSTNLLELMTLPRNTMVVHVADVHQPAYETNAYLLCPPCGVANAMKWGHESGRVRWLSELYIPVRPEDTYAYTYICTHCNKLLHCHAG